jgi:hypothetical protein
MKRGDGGAALKRLTNAQERIRPQREAHMRAARHNTTNECACGELVAYPGASYCETCEESE